MLVIYSMNQNQNLIQEINEDVTSKNCLIKFPNEGDSKKIYTKRYYNQQYNQGENHNLFKNDSYSEKSSVNSYMPFNQQQKITLLNSDFKKMNTYNSNESDITHSSDYQQQNLINLQQQNIALQNILLNKEKKISFLENKIDELNKLQKNNSDKDEINRLKDELNKLQDAFNTCSKRKDNFYNDTKHLRWMLNKQEGLSEKFRKAKEDLENDNNDLKSQIKNKKISKYDNQKIKEIRKDLDNAERKVDQKRKEISDLRREISDLRERLQEKESDMFNLTNDPQSIINLMNTLQPEVRQNVLNNLLLQSFGLSSEQMNIFPNQLNIIPNSLNNILNQSNNMTNQSNNLMNRSNNMINQSQQESHIENNINPNNHFFMLNHTGNDQQSTLLIQKQPSNPLKAVQTNNNLLESQNLSLQKQPSFNSSINKKN